jgi:CubicO group peptidase (beta-lactamase class C family)
MANTDTRGPSAARGPFATFSVPEGWSEQRSGSLVELRPPEADLRFVIVEPGPAPDARTAVAAAWKTYRDKESHAFKLLTPLPARNGWDEQALVEYATSPAEHLSVFATAYRKAQAWTVAILDGGAGTHQKREAQLNAVVESLRPAGYAPETFSGRTAHRLDAMRIAALLDFVRESAAKLDVPGVGLALIDHGEIVYEGGVGVRETGRPAPVDARTRFMVASNTKGMTTLLLARLVDQGKLHWDDPVAKVYPAFRLGDDETTRQVEVRHLVSAFTGLPRTDMEIVFATTAETLPEVTFERLAATRLTSRFGEVYQYNNEMAAAAGYIAGHVAHPDRSLREAYEGAMQELVFDPLAMTDTTFSTPVALADNHASPHGKDTDGALQVLRREISDACAPFLPAGGAWSTPHDMILYVQNELAEGVLADGRLLAPEHLLARRVRGAPTGEASWYGMGLIEDATWGVSVISHGGGLPGYMSDFFAIPAAQVGAVLLTNATDGGFMVRPFMRRLLEVLYDGRPEAAEDVSSVAEQLEAQRIAERQQLTIPAAEADVSGLAPAYANARLGRLEIERAGRSVRVRAQAFTSEVASRRDDDGTVSLVPIDPQMPGWFEIVIGPSNGRATLTVSWGQQVYEFVALD